MIAEHRQYTFDEWNQLTFEQQREIINSYWSPFEPETGKLTRERILKAFCDKINSELEFCEYRYFGFYAEAIFAIPKNLCSKLPTTFAGLTVNRGKKLEKLDNGEWKILWRYSGKETLKLSKDCE